MKKHGTNMLWAAVAGISLVAAGSGCSATGAAMTGGRMVKNLSGDKNFLRVSLDSHEGKQNTLKKAVAGHSEWEIKDSVSTSPVLRYRLIKPERFGRITFTTISIFQEFRGKFSSQPEFTVVPRDNQPESLIRADEDYDLGNPPWHLRVLDVRGNEVRGVKLIPGMKYQVQLTVKADRSETANVYFETD